MNEGKLDQLIREAVQAEHNNSPAPALSTAEAWEQLSQRLQEKRKAEKLKHAHYRSKALYIASAAILLVALFWNPVNSSALGKLTEIVQQVQGAFVQLFVRVDALPGDEDGPLNDYELLDNTFLRSDMMSLEEAQHQTSFEIKVPDYVPEGFQLDSVIVVKEDNRKSEHIYLQYQRDSDIIEIEQKLITVSTGEALVSDYEDARGEKIQIKDQLANLVTFKDGSVELIWVIDELYYYEIRGILSPEEIIAIAESMI